MTKDLNDCDCDSTSGSYSDSQDHIYFLKDSIEV